MTFELLLEDPSATELLGVALGKSLRSGDVLLLSGELGAGKTTLVGGLVRGLGSDDAVTSPTFTLRHEYATEPPLTHVDCWRLERRDELIDLDLDEVLDEGGALVIEWGERARDLFTDALSIELFVEGAARRALLKDVGQQFATRQASLVEALVALGLEPRVTNDRVTGEIEVGS